MRTWKENGSEKNWANNMFRLRKAYNLPLNDANVQNISHKDWSHIVKSTFVRNAFMELEKELAMNKKTNHIEFMSLKPATYLSYLDLQFSFVIFKVRTSLISK